MNVVITAASGILYSLVLIYKTTPLNQLLENNISRDIVGKLTSTAGFLGLARGATVGTGFGGEANKSSSSSANKLSPKIRLFKKTKLQQHIYNFSVHLIQLK